VFSNSGSNTSSSYDSYSSYSDSTEQEEDVFLDNQRPRAVNLLRKQSTRKMDAIAQAMQRQTSGNPSRRESQNELLLKQYTGNLG
jgi:hypothetical protein